MQHGLSQALQRSSFDPHFQPDFAANATFCNVLQRFFMLFITLLPFFGSPQIHVVYESML